MQDNNTAVDSKLSELRLEWLIEELTAVDSLQGEYRERVQAWYGLYAI